MPWAACGTDLPRRTGMGARTAIAPALALWAGTLLGLGTGTLLPVPLAPLLAGALVPLAVCAAWRGWARALFASVLALAALAGLWRGAGHARAIAAERARIEAGPGLHRIEARVCGPGARGGEMVEVEVRAARPPLLAGTRLRLRLPAGRRAGWGDRLGGLARLEVAPPRRNPGGFDARAADFARGIAGRGRLLSVAWHDSSGFASWPRATVVRWRRAIDARLDARLAEPARAYAIPLVTGDRSELAPAQRARVRDAGLAHLLALSGLHVSWLAFLARGLAGALGGGPLARALAGALSALLYVGLAGPLPALARAALTELLRAAARASQRALDPLQALALAVLALLAWRPGWALDLAFQLSSAATFGLVAAARAGSAGAGWHRLLAPLRATAAAQIAAAPLLLAAFHGWSFSVWLANLPAVPLAGLLLGLLWAALILDAALPGAAGPLWLACDLCARGLDTIAAAAAALPFAFSPCGPGAGAAPLATAGAVLLAGRHLAPRTPWAADARERHASRAACLGAVLIGCAALLAAIPSPLAPPPGRAWVVVLDVGQGDATALGLRGGWWLIDAGPRSPGYDAGESVVVPFFRWAGVRSLAGMVVTHMDADHSGGAAAVWRALGPARVACPDSAAATLHPRGRARLQVLAAGDTLADDPALTVLWPAAGTAAGARNERSAVLLFDAFARRALFTADADSMVEARLELPGGVDLLKAGHHGARSSSGEAFLARIHPRMAVISAGRGNRFGHPHSETLARLAAARVRVRRTDMEGAIWCELSADGLRDIDWRANGWAKTGVRPALPGPAELRPPRRR